MSSDFEQDDESDGSIEEEPLFPLGGSDDDDSDNDKFYHTSVKLPSDLDEDEDEDKDDEINVTAWGKNRKTYYSADYVDKDFGGFEGSDAEMAEEEEKEALQLQKALAAELDNDDFGMEMFKKAENQVTENLEKIVIDSSTLGLNEKLELVKTESPELIDLIEHIREKFGEAKELLNSGSESGNELTECTNVKLQLLLRYCVNGLFYLAMKAKREPMNNHPIRKRISTYQLLLSQMKSVHDDEDEEISDEDDINYKQNSEDEMDVEDEDEDEHASKRVRFDVETEPTDEKRGISNQIAKNRGLTPRRKKEYKNPRVKHRLKFRKAKIRRRGQIREPTTELKRYGGEISGIKIGVKKGIKLK